MNSTLRSVFFFLGFIQCAFGVPYGFGRQEDAIVVEAAPSFSPVASNPSSDPVHSPSCRHRVYYTPSSYSGSSTRQNYQTTYHGTTNRQQDAVVVDAAPSFSPIESYPSNSVNTPSCRQCQTRYNDYPSNVVRQSYQTYSSYQPVRNVVRNYDSSYGSYRTPSGSAESPNYYQRQNDIQDYQDSSKVS